MDTFAERNPEVDEATEYVFDATQNYEPAYLALEAIAVDFDRGLIELDEATRAARAIIEEHREAMGLTFEDLDADVDYAAMIRSDEGS